MWPAAGGPLLAAPVQILLTRPVTSSAITGESGAASSEGALHGDVTNGDAASLMDHAETSRRNQDFQFNSVESSIFTNLWGAVIVMWWDGRFGLLLTHEGVQAWQDLPSEEWSLISLEAKTNSFRLEVRWSLVSKYLLFCCNSLKGCKDKGFLSRLPTLIMLKWSDSTVGVVWQQQDQ